MNKKEHKIGDVIKLRSEIKTSFEMVKKARRAFEEAAEFIRISEAMFWDAIKNEVPEMYEKYNLSYNEEENTVSLYGLKD